VPALHEKPAGSDQGAAPPEGGWSSRIRVQGLRLRDERDLAGEKANLTIDAMPLKLRPTCLGSDGALFGCEPQRRPLVRWRRAYRRASRTEALATTGIYG
jgi:hypothetical protein